MTTKTHSLPTVAQARDRLASLSDEANTAGQQLIATRDRHTQAIRAALNTGDHAATTKTATALDSAKRAHDRARELVEAAEAQLTEAKQREAETAEKTARQHVADVLAEMVKSAREADQLFASAAGILERLRAQETELHRFIRGTFGVEKSPSSSPLIAAEAGRGFGAFLRSVAINNRTDARPWTEDAVEAGAGNVRRGLEQ